MKATTDTGTVELGTTEAGVTIGIVDFSRRTTDDFGVTTVTRRGFARRMAARIVLPFDEVDAVQRQLAALRATKARWTADERFAWLDFEGFYRDFEIDLALPPYSHCTLTVEGLVETETVEDDGGDPAPDGESSSLLLLHPVAIGDGELTDSSVPETDWPQWSAEATYDLGDRVIKTATHRIYESATDGNTGHDPEAATGEWIDVGPTNRWAMFDQALGTATTATGSIAVVIDPGAVGAVALLDVTGSTVRVQTTGYDKTKAAGPGAVTFLDLPGAGDPITVTVLGAGEVAVGTLLAGALLPLGSTEANPTAALTDYSRKEADDFGEIEVVERAWAKRMTARARIRTEAIDQVANRIAAVRATPALWIGKDGLDSLTIYGFFKDFSIETSEPLSTLNLQVEGLAKAAPIPPRTIEWVNVEDSDPSHPKPEDGATKGAPEGTEVAGRPAEDLVGQVDEHEDAIDSHTNELQVLYDDMAAAELQIQDLFETYGPTESAMNSAAIAEAAAQNAQTAAEDAADARDAAGLARDAAELHKQAAETAQATAETALSDALSAKNAAQSAQNAAEQAKSDAEDAEAAAIAAATTAGGHATTASNKADEAAGYASAASASATTATTKAGEATSSAASAATSASDAEGYKNAAATSATNAANSASTAQGHANAASSSASTAATKATEASTSASAAQTAANTATTKAGEASTSASSAATSASNAQGYANTASSQATVAANAAETARLTAASLLPERYMTGDEQVFTNNTIGSPQSRPIVTSNATISGYGPVYQVSASGTTLQDWGPIGCVPAVAGRVYEVEGEFEVTAYSGSPRLFLYLRGLNDSYANIIANGPQQNITAAGTYTLVRKFSDTSGSGINQWPAGSVWLRPLLRTDPNSGTATVRFKRVTIKDVTEREAAATSASAAATSASTASTQASNAATSATAANSAKVSAETAAGSASSSASAAAVSASTATSQANAAQQSAQLAASIGLGVMNKNPVFADWPTGQSAPTNWTIVSVTPVREAGLYGASAPRLDSAAGQNSVALSQAIGSSSLRVVQSGDWLVLECDATLISGTMTGAGVAVSVYDSSGTLLQTLTGEFQGGTQIGRLYTIRKLVQVTNANAHYLGITVGAHVSWHGSIAAANSVRFHRASVRYATETEIRDQTVYGPMSVTVTEHSSAIAAVEGDITTLFGKWGVQVDVNGRVVGIALNNNGNSGSFDVHADYFTITKPGGGERFEFSDGSGRVYDSSGTLRVRWGVWS